MAIQQFGESLLSNVRKRNDDEEKRRRKEAEKAALVGLGATVAIGVGNELLSSKTASFLNNEQVLNARIQQKQASSNAANIFSTEQAIQASGLSYEDYFAKNMRPVFEARAKENLDIDVTGPAGAYNDMVTTQVRQFAKQQSDAHRRALVLANNISDKGDYESVVALNAKAARPTSVGKALTGGIARLFTGKSKEDIDQEALLAITEGPMSENAEQLNVFMKEYNSSKDLVGAYDFAKFVVPDPTAEDRLYKTDEVTTVEEIGKVTYQVTTIKKTNRNTGEVTSAEEVKKLDNTAEAFDAAGAKSFSSIFNYGKTGQQQLTTEAFASFAKAAKELNIRPEAPLNLQEYVKLGNLYSTFTTDKLNLRDTFRQDQILNLQEVLVTRVQNIQAMIAAAETDPDKRDQLTGTLAFEIKQLMDFSSSIVTGGAGGTDFNALYNRGN